MSEIGKFTAKELEQYEASMRDMSDYYNIIDTAAEEAEKRGMAKGMEIGREEGREEGMVEMLKKMFESGMGYKEISQISGLSESQVQTYLQK